jgi:hypothetical protein
MNERRRRRSTLFRDTVTMKLAIPPWQSDNCEVRDTWLEKLRVFLLDWPPVYGPHSTISVTGLAEPDFSREVSGFLMVYYSGVANALNTVPTLMWTYPGRQGLHPFALI